MKRLFAVMGLALALALALGAASASAAVAGPFGFEQGYPFSKLKIVSKSDTAVYVVKAPAPNSEFDQYVVFATPQDGVCKVIASSKNYENDQDGYQIRDLYNHLKSILKSKYGENQEIDALHDGAIWTKSSDFATSLLKNERSLISVWSASEKSTLPVDLGAIGLKAEALDQRTTYISVHYEFKNFPACKSRIDNANNNTL